MAACSLLGLLVLISARYKLTQVHKAMVILELAFPKQARNFENTLHEGANSKSALLEATGVGLRV